MSGGGRSNTCWAGRYFGPYPAQAHEKILVVLIGPAGVLGRTRRRPSPRTQAPPSAHTHARARADLCLSVCVRARPCARACICACACACACLCLCLCLCVCARACARAQEFTAALSAGGYVEAAAYPGLGLDLEAGPRALLTTQSPHPLQKLQVKADSEQDNRDSREAPPIRVRRQERRLAPALGLASQGQPGTQPSASSGSG